MRILVADDHCEVRNAIAGMLQAEADFTVVGEVGNGEDAVRLAEELQPDVILMDMSMPGLNGLEATRRIAARCPQVKVIGLSLYDGPEHVQAVLSAGAACCVDKAAAPESLVAAVRACRPQ